MHIFEFDYHLPKELIAQKPLKERDSSRLLVVDRDSGFCEHRCFKNLVDMLDENDVLVMNKSRVIPARLYTSKGYEVFLLKRILENPIQYECLVKPGKRFQKGGMVFFDEYYEAKITDIIPESGIRIIEFPFSDFEAFLYKYGNTPLPPYIKEKLDDAERYQTIYSSENEKGSVAAPTAGLHFTENLLQALERKGVKTEYVTLHVGLGTFQPVKIDNIKEHKMHSEWFFLDTEVAQRLNQYKKEGKRIVAVGTTSVRVLENCMDKTGILQSQTGETDIFIYPGYKFCFIDALITNFHLPKSTLLMLVSAFAGKDLILKAYEEAIREKYRFYSFGDSMMIE